MAAKVKQQLTKTFNIDYVSLIDDVRYQGAFTTKKRSIADISALGVRKAQLNGGLHNDPSTPGRGVDPDTDDLNSMIAHLDICLIQYPKWWNLNEIADVGLLRAVYEEVAEFETSFLNRTRASTDNGSVGSKQNNSSRTVQESDSRADVSSLVDPEISSALEP